MEMSDSVGSRRSSRDRYEESQLIVDDDVGDISFDIDDFSQLPEEEEEVAKPKKTLTGLAPLMTAADLLAQGDSPRVAVERFHQGMLVQHPEYGNGLIIALAGQGVKRAATVRFFRGSSEKKFMLAHANLKPVASEEELFRQFQVLVQMHNRFRRIQIENRAA
jgi:hypothetical protein